MLNLRIDSHMPFVIGNLDETGAVTSINDSALLNTAAQNGFDRLVVPEDDAIAAQTAGVEVIGIRTLHQLIRLRDLSL